MKCSFQTRLKNMRQTIFHPKILPPCFAHHSVRSFAHPPLNKQQTSLSQEQFIIHFTCRHGPHSFSAPGKQKHFVKQINSTAQKREWDEKKGRSLKKTYILRVLRFFIYSSDEDEIVFSFQI